MARYSILGPMFKLAGIGIAVGTTASKIMVDANPNELMLKDYNFYIGIGIATLSYVAGSIMQGADTRQIIREELERNNKPNKLEKEAK